MLSLRETIERVAGVKFERAGGGFKAHCPFHAERTPSFFVQEELGRYKCFGAACGARGDVIQFLGDWHGIGFSEALEKAADLAGLPPPGVRNFVPPSARNEWFSAWQTVYGAIQASRIGPKAAQLRMRPSATFLDTVPPDVEVPETGKPVAIFDPVACRELRVRPTHVHVYRSEKSEISCLVLRQSKTGGGKFFLQAAWQGHSDRLQNSAARWTLARFPRDVLRPLYGLEDVPRWIDGAGSKILFVEGEKTRDAAARLLPVESTGVLCLTCMGGANAVKFSEMHPLLDALGRRADSTGAPTVHVWPDADSPVIRPGGKTVDRQRRFAEDIASALRSCAAEARIDLRETEVSRVVPPSGATGGWDLADALHQGWNTQRVVDRIRGHSLPVFVSGRDHNCTNARLDVSHGGIEIDPCLR